MPKLRIPTDQGILEVPVDRIPESDAEMQQIAEQAIAQMSGGQSQAAASMTKTAVPKSEPYDPSFMGTLSREFSGGMSDVKAGIGEMLSLPNRGEVNPISGAIQAALGGARAITSPITAAGAFAGEQSGERARATMQDDLGLSPDVSAAIGTAIGAPINAMTQLYSVPKAVSKMAPYAMKGVQATARALPGAQVTLRNVGKKIIESLPNALKPATPSRELFDELSKFNPKTPLPLFQQAARNITKREAKLEGFGLANRGLESTAARTVKATSESINPSAKWLGDEFGITPETQLKDISFDIVKDIRQRLGDKIGELRVQGGAELGSYKQLFKHISEDLEKAADVNTGEAFKLLKKANAAANREFAIGELDDIFNATLGRALEGQKFDSTSFARALNKVRDLRRSEPLFEKGIGPHNLDRIEARLDEFRKLKVNPPPKGVNVGSALVATRLGAGTGLGYAIGNMVGGPAMGATLGGMGAVAATVGPPIVSRIMQSEKGSRALLNVLKREGTVSAEHISAALALVKGEEAVRNDLAGRIQSMLKTPEVPIEEKIRAATQGDQVFKQVEKAEFFMRQ